MDFATDWLVSLPVRPAFEPVWLPSRSYAAKYGRRIAKAAMRTPFESRGQAQRQDREQGRVKRVIRLCLRTDANSDCEHGEQRSQKRQALRRKGNATWPPKAQNARHDSEDQHSGDEAFAGCRTCLFGMPR